ncbi:hypothetical protein MPRI_22970 [Mycobacterium paraintracellulare]|uniref:Secreted protein n=1 Tax=Mycobacterium paraintracellulare TaxID=1138383 RepID=A0ABN6ARJ6_9MYCO|nr:hypothetical protein MPRI_22970 [Mycobacterium paraintracellulare]
MLKKAIIATLLVVCSASPTSPAYADFGPSGHGKAVALQRAPAPLDPVYCYSTQQFLPWPDFSGYCPDGESPFNGPGPSYGGGNHRYPDGSDD